MYSKTTNKNNKSIIVAHPLQQHSYKLATALEKSNMLKSYYTTVYYKENRFVYKILNKVLGKENIKRMKGRSNSFFDRKVFQFNEILGLLHIDLEKT